MSTDPAATWPKGTELVLLDRVDSTMDEAARQAPPQRPTWIVALEQTGARGRQGKPWLQPPGNFAGTFLTKPDRPLAEIGLTSFMAALALYDALARYVSAERLSLKWPNDVLLDGKKVAGILLESSSTGLQVDWLAVGIGINLVATPPVAALPDGALPPISLQQASPDHTAPDVRTMATVLAQAMDHWDSQWTTHGFAPIRTLWLGRAARLGEAITVRLPNETLQGVFETVDPDGCLVLQTPNGPRRISAGEVFLR